MKKKICIPIIFIIVLMVTPIVNAADSLTVTDNINDTVQYDEFYDVIKENISDLEDADIEELSFTQDGKEVEVTFKLADGGVLRPTLDSNIYSVILYTASPNIAYRILYLGAGAELVEDVDLDFIISDYYYNNFYDVKDKDIEENYFSVTFELENRNEKCLTLAGFAIFAVDNDSIYQDSVPDSLTDIENITSLQALAGGPYKATTGQNIVFQGDLETGNPSDYEWVWLIDQNEDYLYGQNPTHKFNFAGNYTGTLYVYNDQGEFGFEYFTVDVSGKDIKSSGGGDSDSGSGLMMFVILIAIIIIIGVAVVVIALRR